MFIWPDGRPCAVQRAGRERPLPSTPPSPAYCGFTNRLRTSTRYMYGQPKSASEIRPYRLLSSAARVLSCQEVAAAR